MVPLCYLHSLIPASVCAPAGSVILWESRTVHYGAAPKEGANPRYATCKGTGYHALSDSHADSPHYLIIIDVCYKPAAHCPPAHLESRKEAIRDYQNMVSTAISSYVRGIPTHMFSCNRVTTLATLAKSQRISLTFETDQPSHSLLSPASVLENWPD